MRNLICLAVVSVVALAQRVDAASLTVAVDGSAMFQSIQSAVDAAATGDVVLVFPGTYTASSPVVLDFRGKSITVRAIEGPASTKIQAVGGQNALRFASGETSDAVLEGLRVETSDQAFANSGLAIQISGASPTMRDCWISYVGAGASAMSATGSAALFVGCYFNGFTQSGAMCNMTNSVCTFLDCHFSGGALWGGGVRLASDASHFVGCVFDSNQSNGTGGAVRIQDSNTEFRQCSFRSNRADGQNTCQCGAISRSGGAIAIYGSTSSVSVLGCTFDINRVVAVSYVWAVMHEYFYYPGFARGGAIYVGSGNLRLEDCSFSGNTATENSRGGAIAFDGNGELRITRCWFVRDAANKGAEVALNDGGGAARLIMTDSQVVANPASSTEGFWLVQQEGATAPRRIANSVFTSSHTSIQLQYLGSPAGQFAAIGGSSFCGNASVPIAGEFRSLGPNCFTAECTDANEDGVPDECFGTVCVDCNGNGMWDSTELALGLATDSDADGVIDGCGGCSGDFDHDGWVGGADLVALLTNWGQPGPRPEDLDRSGIVDAGDVGLLLAAWGACP